MDDKIRIQVLDDEHNVLSTKVLKLSTFGNSVDLLSNLKKGQVNFNFTAENIESYSNYIRTFRKIYREGIRLEKEKENQILRPKKRHKPSKDNQNWEDYREKFIRDAIEKSKNNQDAFIHILRENDFVFMDSITLLDRFPNLSKHISKIKLGKYQWMLKVLKFGVSPEKDSFDPLILIGIKISPERDRKIVVYHNKKFLYSLLMEIPKRLDGVKPKPVQLIKYPDWMTYDERQKWGKEHRKLLADPELKPSKFYDLYNTDIIVKGYLVITEINNKL